MYEKKGPPGDIDIPVTEHLVELRRRVLVVFACIFLATMAIYPLSGGIINAVWSDLLPSTVGMTVYTPLEFLMTRIVVSLVVALAVGVPLIMYEAVAFMTPGLYPEEERFLKVVFPSSLLLFIAGAALAYFVALPLIFHLTVYSSGTVAAPAMSVGRTLKAVLTAVAGFGIIFQLPLLLVFMIYTGLVSEEGLREKRIIVYLILLTFAIFIAPDPTAISQLLVATCLVVLFEFSLLISRVLLRRSKEASN